MVREGDLLVIQCRLVKLMTDVNMKQPEGNSVPSCSFHN
jgi:hypothetical protein